jgi:hypothetical protein
MKRDVLLAASQTEGLRISNEVDLMPGCGEFNAELGGDNTAAAVGGIAGNSDLHNVPE